MRMLLIAHAHSDAKAIGQRPEDVHLAGARRAQFEEQCADVQTAKRIEERAIVAAERRALIIVVIIRSPISSPLFIA